MDLNASETVVSTHLNTSEEVIKKKKRKSQQGWNLLSSEISLDKKIIFLSSFVQWLWLIYPPLWPFHWSSQTEGLEPVHTQFPFDSWAFTLKESLICIAGLPLPLDAAQSFKIRGMLWPKQWGCWFVQNFLLPPISISPFSSVFLWRGEPEGCGSEGYGEVKGES